MVIFMASSVSAIPGGGMLMLGEWGGGREPSPPLPLQPHQLFWGAGCPEPAIPHSACGEHGHLSGTTLQPFSL